MLRIVKMVHQVLPKVFATVAHMLAEAGEKSGDSVALTFEGRTLTYSEFVRCVGGFANELLGLDARHRRGAGIEPYPRGWRTGGRGI